MNGHPFSKNLIDNVFVPSIVNSIDGYGIDLNMQNITNIGTTGNRVDNIWVNTIHFLDTDPVISGGGGGGGGGVGAQGPTGPTGLQGIPGPTGPPGDSNSSGISISGPIGQIPFFTQEGITSSSSFNINNNLLTTPNTNISNQSLLSLYTNQTSNIQTGQYQKVGSGNSLFISDVGNSKNTATFDTLNSRVGIKTNLPSYDLDVNGQTRISYSGPNASYGTTILGSGNTGSIVLSPGIYNLYSWGQGGYGNGGGAGYLSGSLNINSGTTLNWDSIPGGLGSFNGGSAATISLGPTLMAIVPGGGGGATLSQGGWYGSTSGNPLFQSGYSAVNENGGTGGFVTTSNSLVTINQTFNANVLTIEGRVALPEDTDCFIPAGTEILAINNGYIIDNVNSIGLVIFNPSSVMTNAAVTITGVTGLTFSNVVLAQSDGTTVTAAPFTFETPNLSYVPYTNNSTNIIDVVHGLATTNQPIPISNVSNLIYPPLTSLQCYTSDIQRFVTTPGFATSSIAMSITSPASYNNVSVNTLTNTATFTRDTVVRFNRKILTNNSTFNIGGTRMAFPTGIQFPVSTIITNGVDGSYLSGGSGASGGAGGGAGYYGGGGGIDGGGGGAGSGYIESFLNGNVFNGKLDTASGRYTPFSKYNNIGTVYGWGGTNPALPYTIIEQTGITLSVPNPALFVNGNETLTGDLTVNGSLNIGSNTLITSQILGTSGTVSSNLTIIEQETTYPVNNLPNRIILRPTSGPPQGLSITHQTGMTYTNDCLVNIDGDLTARGIIYADSFVATASTNKKFIIGSTGSPVGSQYDVPDQINQTSGIAYMTVLQGPSVSVLTFNNLAKMTPTSILTASVHQYSAPPLAPMIGDFVINANIDFSTNMVMFFIKPSGTNAWANNGTIMVCWSIT